MTSQPVKRNSSGADTTLKVFILAGSLSGTIGGWALLATGQLAEAVSAARQTSAIVQSVRPSLQESAPNDLAIAPTLTPALRRVTLPTPAPTLRQVSVPTLAPAPRQVNVPTPVPAPRQVSVPMPAPAPRQVSVPNNQPQPPAQGRTRSSR